jgi:hypothetical protein
MPKSCSLLQRSIFWLIRKMSYFIGICKICNLVTSFQKSLAGLEKSSMCAFPKHKEKEKETETEKEIKKNK